MKNNIKTLLINALLIIVGLASNPFTAYCQTSIDGIAGANTKPSIIRVADIKTAVVYKHDGTIGTFSVVNLISGIEKITDIHQNVIVNDFEIFNNRMVLFCGENTVQRRGCIGWFYIDDIRNNTGAITYHDITPQSQTETIRAFNKMDYYVDNTATPNILHIAATTYFHNTPYNTYSYGLTDVMIELPNMTLHTPEYYNENGGVERYDDIVATDNSLVAVIYKINGNAQYMRKYNALVFGQTIFQDPCCNDYCNWGNIYRPEEQQSFITHVSRDSVATVFFAEFGGSKGIGICVYNAAGSPPIVVDNIFIPFNATSFQTWNIADFVYDVSSRMFTALINTNTNIPNLIFRIGYSSGIWSTNCSIYDNNASMQITSIDKYTSSNLMSGHITTSDEPCYLIFDNVIFGSCFRVHTIPLLFPTIYDSYAKSSIIHPLSSFNTYTSAISSSTIYLYNICR